MRKDPSTNQSEYLVKYVGYSSEHDEWHTEQELAYCVPQIQDFEQRQAKKGPAAGKGTKRKYQQRNETREATKRQKAEAAAQQGKVK